MKVCLKCFVSLHNRAGSKNAKVIFFYMVYWMYSLCFHHLCFLPSMTSHWRISKADLPTCKWNSFLVTIYNVHKAFLNYSLVCHTINVFFQDFFQEIAKMVFWIVIMPCMLDYSLFLLIWLLLCWNILFVRGWSIFTINCLC